MFWKVLIALLFALTATANAEVPHSIKASSPVSVSIYPENEVNGAGEVVFVVSAFSTISADDFEINVELPADVSLRSGETSWRGAIEAGQPREITFSVLLPVQMEQGITATARILTSSSSQLASSATYQTVSEFSSAVKMDDGARKSTRTTQRNNRNITEYTLP